MAAGLNAFLFAIPAPSPYLPVVAKWESASAYWENLVPRLTARRVSPETKVPELREFPGT
jgi:hypothetical protein